MTQGMHGGLLPAYTVWGKQLFRGLVALGVVTAPWRVATLGRFSSKTAGLYKTRLSMSLTHVSIITTK